MSNYIYHGTQDLITLPERAVQTFPSGLVRVDRVYACRKNQVARFRDQLRAGNPLPFDDGAPAIDGLFIFPEPRETIRDDGFAEFRVSAYGRTSTTGTARQIVALSETNRTIAERNLVATVLNIIPVSYNFSQIIQESAFQTIALIEEFVDPVGLRSEVRVAPITDPRVIRITNLPLNSIITSNPSEIPRLEVPITATDGGFIIQWYQSEQDIGDNLSSFATKFNARATVYLFNTSKLKAESVESRGFGRFSEFIVTYLPEPEALRAVVTGRSEQFFVNGQRLFL